MTIEEWQRRVADDPSIPRSADQMRTLRSKLLGDGTSQNTFECMTCEAATYQLGLRNPGLTDSDREALSLGPNGDLDERATASTSMINSAHFVVFYNAQNISPNVAADTSRELEAAYQTYLGNFGIAIAGSGNQRCEVHFGAFKTTRTFPPGRSCSNPISSAEPIPSSGVSPVFTRRSTSSRAQQDSPARASFSGSSREPPRGRS